MIKKILLVLSMMFAFSCELFEEVDYTTMKLWLDGEEIDVEAEYQKVTAFPP